MLEGQPSSRDVCIYGVPCFPDTAGVTLFSMHTHIGHSVMRMPGDVPSMTDGKTAVKGAHEVLFYLAEHYAPAYLPEDPALHHRVTAAMESFASDMYPHAVNTIDVSMGFHDAHKTREDALAAGQAASVGLDEFSNQFLKDTFVGGQKLSIADFRVAPFFIAYAHSVVQEMCGVVVPERIKKFNKDFEAAASAACKILYQAKGLAIVEVLDTVPILAGRVPTSPAACFFETPSKSAKEADCSKAASERPQSSRCSAVEGAQSPQLSEPTFVGARTSEARAKAATQRQNLAPKGPTTAASKSSGFTRTPGNQRRGCWQQ